MRKPAITSVLALSLAAPALAEEIGECRFSRETLTFAGTPLEQATCLLRHVGQLAVRREQPLPRVITRLMTEGGAPSEAQKAAALAAFPEPYRAYALDHASDPVSQTEAGLPLLDRFRASLELIRMGLEADAIPHAGVLAAVGACLPGEPAKTLAEVQARFGEVQPIEFVGLSESARG